jgi:molybdopterin-biosynthesis enzyme MoeA-like protein
MIRDFYAALHRRGEVTTAEMLPARTKMAQMPQGAEPLRNRVGAAPGVLLTAGRSTIVALPGVPAEMKDIFANSLAPRLGGILEEQIHAERTVRTRVWDESILAPAVDEVASRHPRVYVKSRAQVYGTGVPDFVTLAASAPDEANLQALLDAAEADLRTELKHLGIEVE